LSLYELIIIEKYRFFSLVNGLYLGRLTTFAEK